MKLTIEEYKNLFSEEDSAPGWDVIDQILKEIYPQQEPRHFGTLLSYRLGGNDPLDGISIYDSNQQSYHRHLVSYGMSELYYSPESVDNEYSQWGFEFTFRLTPYTDDKDEEGNKNEPKWVIAFMQNLARYVFDSEKWFEPYHFIPANGPIRLDSNTNIVGVAFVLDPQLGSISTPHGKVDFLQMVGLTQKELDYLWKEPTIERVEKLINLMREDNPLLITDLSRKQSYIPNK